MILNADAYSKTKIALRFLANGIIIDITTQTKNYPKNLIPLRLLDIVTFTKTTTGTTTETGAKRNSYVAFYFRKSELRE